MRVAVVGAGIVGVCSAHYLQAAGHDVALIDRRGNVAQETSFANAGVIAPGYVTPWAAPGMPGKVLRGLLRAASPVVFRPSFDRALWRWARGWLRECDLDRYRANKARMQRLAFYSREQLHELRGQLTLEYEQHAGYLQLLRTARDVALAQPALALLAEAGVAHEVVDAARCRAIEPGLAADTPLAAGVWLPQDESGNCALFARRLKARLEASGVALHMDSVVRAIEPAEFPRLVLDDNTVVETDAIVICAGVESPALLGPLGIDLPLYPVKGYSITMPIRQFERAPVGALMDEHYKVAITRLGMRMRVAGTAELGTPGLTIRPRALRTLWRVVRDWFGPAPDYTCPQLWIGARPMLPDGAPLLGPTAHRGIYVNLGHGSSGWAMACGSGKIVADLVSGRRPGISLEGLTLADRHPA